MVWALGQLKLFVVIGKIRGKDVSLKTESVQRILGHSLKLDMSIPLHIDWISLFLKVSSPHQNSGRTVRPGSGEHQPLMWGLATLLLVYINTDTHEHAYTQRASKLWGRVVLFFVLSGKCQPC